MIDVKKYREDNPYLYGNSSLKEVASDLFKYNPDLQSAYKDVDDWAEKEDLKASWDDDEASVAAKRRHRELALQRQQNLNDMNFATRSVARGYNQTQAMLGGAIGLAGDLVGSEKLKKWGLESYKKNTEEASLYPGTDIKDIKNAPLLMKPFKAGQWALEKLGENLPNIALSMATAGTAGAVAGTGRVMGNKIVQKALGGMLAKSVRNQIAGKGILKKLATRQGVSLADRAILQAADRAVVQNIAAKAGIVASTGALEAGGMYTEGADEGFHNPVSALGLGILSGFTEIVGGVPTRQIEKLFGKKVSRSFFGALRRVQNVDANPGDVNFISRVFKGAMESMPEEAAQEGIQEAIALANHVIANNDPGFEVLSMESLKRIGESMAAGGAVGALIGGGSGAFNFRDAVDRYDKTDGTDADANRALLDTKRAEAATSSISKIVGGELEKEPEKKSAPKNNADEIIKKLQSGENITKDEAKILKNAISKIEEKPAEQVLSEAIPADEEITVEDLSKNKKAKDAIAAISEGKTLTKEQKPAEVIKKAKKEGKLEKQVSIVGNEVEKKKTIVSGKPKEAPEAEKRSTAVKKEPTDVATGRKPVPTVDDSQAQEPTPVAPKVEANREQAAVPTSLSENEKRGRASGKEKKTELTRFLGSGKGAYEVTRSKWVEMQRAERKALGQSPISGTAAAPNSDYEQYHERSVKEAIAKGKKVSSEVLKDYPDLSNEQQFKTRPKHEKKNEKAQVDQTFKDIEALKAEIAGEEKPKKPETGPLNQLDAGGPSLVSTGERYTSQAGRALAPAPKVDTSTPIKSKNTIKRVAAWLKDEAVKEAESRSDNFNKRSFEQINANRATRADLDSMNLYLFGNIDGPENKSASVKKRGKEEFASTGKPGDRTSLMGTPATFQQAFNEEGVSTELWSGDDGSGIMRTVDGDSGKTVSIVKHASFKTIKDKFLKNKKDYENRSLVPKQKAKKTKIPDISPYDLKSITVKYKERIAEVPDKQIEITMPADEAVENIDNRVESCYVLASCLGIKVK